MKKLLMKEIKLAASPLTWFFIAFAAMTMIPGYPILVGAFFVCLGIFYSFQSAREHNDTLYTALLPVRKGDVVRAKFAFTILVQTAALLLTAALTALRMTVLRDGAVYTGNAMMNANLAYIGYVLFIFGLFNTVFLTGFFRTAYYIGKSFIFFCILSFLVVALGETLHHIPGLTLLNSTGTEGLGLQCAVLAAGAVFYGAGTALARSWSEKRFERIDL